jgi:hypothetical protein
VFDGLIIGDFIDNVNIHVEIIDVAGSTVNDHPSGEYHSEVGPLTFSRNISTIDHNTGLHLLSPPLQTEIDWEIIGGVGYDCSNGGCVPIDGNVNSGEGFYIKNEGATDSIIFTGDVIPQLTIDLQEEWNLVGNPLVTPFDVNSLIITYNNIDYNWQDAANVGIIAPNPIIYDNDFGGHVGTDILSTAAGFQYWDGFISGVGLEGSKESSRSLLTYE